MADIIVDIVKGDSVDLECTYDGGLELIKIRFELYDLQNHSLKKANDLSGGNDNQIEVIDEINGKFVIHINAGETSLFDRFSLIEIEFELSDGKVFTVYQGKVKFINQKIDWETP